MMNESTYTHTLAVRQSNGFPLQAKPRRFRFPLILDSSTLFGSSKGSGVIDHSVEREVGF